MKHIEFSQGFYFLDDLQEHMQNSSQTERQQKFDFTYNIQDQLKIDLDKAKQNKLKKEEARRQEFEALKNKMEKEPKEELKIA